MNSMGGETLFKIARMLCISGGFLFAANTVQAQYGASPSQSGLFFDDLKNRATQSKMGSAVRSGEAVYDYQSENSAFTYTAEGREMGAAQTVTGMNEAARQMGQSAYRTGGGATAARAVGDYTYYSSQYSSPNTFFAPSYVSDPFMGGKRNIKVGGSTLALDS